MSIARVSAKHIQYFLCYSEIQGKAKSWNESTQRRLINVGLLLETQFGFGNLLQIRFLTERMQQTLP